MRRSGCGRKRRCTRRDCLYTRLPLGQRHRQLPPLPGRLASGAEADGETRLVPDPVAVEPSARALQAAERAVDALLSEAQADVAALLDAHAAALIALADALQATDSVSGRAVEDIIDAHPPAASKGLAPPPPKANANAV